MNFFKIHVQDITMGFCWYACTEKASSKMADSDVLREYLTSPVRDFMQKLQLGSFENLVEVVSSRLASYLQSCLSLPNV